VLYTIRQIALYCRLADGGGGSGKCPAPCKKGGELVGKGECVQMSRWKCPDPLAIAGVSVCLSITRWYWLKANDRRITRLHRRVDQGLVLFATNCHIIGPRGTPSTPLQALQTRQAWVKAKYAHFSQITRYISETIEDWHLRWRTNRKWVEPDAVVLPLVGRLKWHCVAGFVKPSLSQTELLYFLCLYNLIKHLFGDKLD